MVQDLYNINVSAVNILKRKYKSQSNEIVKYYIFLTL